MRRVAILGVVFGLSLGGPVLAERSFGLVVGIDDYAYIPDLYGAVNDAEDIADALSDSGAEVTLLLDGEATRAAILAAWEDVLDRAAPGDRLVVSYAGHGSNEPEHVIGSEEDGRDENFLLAGFAPRGAAAAERIRDDEIAVLLERSAHLEVIFVADACHAGTVTRDLEPALGYRYVTPEGISEDPLPPPPPPPAGGESEDNVALFLAAVNEAEKVPEVLIDGVARGALSYAFASGIRGAADLDGDGTITKGELEAHVRRTVRKKSDGVQLPQSSPAGQEARPLMAVSGEATSPAPAPPPRPLTERPFAALPPLAVAGNWSGVSGVLAGSEGVLSRQGAVVRSSVGDAVALAPTRDAAQAVADKHRLVAALDALAHPTLEIAFDSGDRTYRDGEVLRVNVLARQTPYVTLFNLGSDGTLSYLYPVRDAGLGLDDPDSRPVGDKVALPVKVAPPFGADHVIAVETDRAPPEFRRRLADLSGSRDMAALWELLRRSEGRVAVFPFFTGEET